MSPEELFLAIRDEPFLVEMPGWGGISCTQKHTLLGRVLERQGITVSYVSTQFYWHELRELGVMVPDTVQNLAKTLGPTYHLSCELVGRLVDATWDAPLKRAGFTINTWDECVLPVLPHRQRTFASIETYSEFINSLRGGYAADELRRRAQFYTTLNTWLEAIRKD